MNLWMKIGEEVQNQIGETPWTGLADSYFGYHRPKIAIYLQERNMFRQFYQDERLNIDHMEIEVPLLLYWSGYRTRQEKMAVIRIFHLGILFSIDESDESSNVDFSLVEVLELKRKTTK